MAIQRALNTATLRNANYEARFERLEITFASGEIRVFKGVPEEVARRFFASPNPASYYEDRIVEEYAYERRGVGANEDARKKLDDLFS
jgi:hypothetical protein